MMVDIADYVERGEDPKVALQDDIALTDGELDTLSATIDKLVGFATCEGSRSHLGVLHAEPCASDHAGAEQG